MFKFFKKNWGILAVIILSFFAMRPLLQQGFFTIHDDTQVARIFEMGKSLKDGMVPVRWVNDLGYGYGYPIFNFYAPLSYYFGGIILLLGVNALLATKITFIIGILLAGISMYFFAKMIWGELGGILSAIFYQFATYHAVDTYVRGDLSELWAYAIIPLVFLSLYKIYNNYNSYKTYTWISIEALSYAGVILSHNLTAMMTTPFLLLFIILLVLISKNKLTTAYYLLLASSLGIIISAFYWLPALAEIKYTNVLSQIGGGADYRDHFVCLQQFWFSNWGYGGSTKGCIDGISFMLGKFHIIFTLAVFILSILFRKIFNKKEFTILLFFYLGLGLSLFIELEQSRFIWEALKPMAFFQYPWRFLILASFFSSTISGGLIQVAGSIFSKKLKITLFVASMILLIVVQSKFFSVHQILHVSSEYYTNSKMLFRTSKISDEYMPKGFIKPISSQVLIDNMKQKTQNKVYTSFEKVLPIAYFPAWQVFIDGKKQVYEATNTGLAINASEGEHIITASFVQTDIEKISNLVTLCGILILILGIIYQAKHYGNKSK